MSGFKVSSFKLMVRVRKSRKVMLRAQRNKKRRITSSMVKMMALSRLSFTDDTRLCFDELFILFVFTGSIFWFTEVVH